MAPGGVHGAPKPARFVFTVGMALAMALTILAITADRDLASPTSSAVYPVVLKGPQAARGWNVEPAWLRPMIAPEDSSAPSAALLPSSEHCGFFDQSRKRPDPPCEFSSTTGPGFATRGAPILVEAVTRSSAVQKMTVAAMDIISSR